MVSNPSRKQRARSAERHFWAEAARTYAHGTRKAKAKGAPAYYRERRIKRALKKGRTLKDNPPRAPKRSARTGRFVRG